MSTIKTLQWVRDNGDHTHVNAPDAETLRKLTDEDLISYDSFDHDKGEYT